MWLKLGDSEVINLDFISTIKKNPEKSSIDIIYHDLNNIKTLPFRSYEDRDRAYNAILENLAKMRIFFE